MREASSPTSPRCAAVRLDPAEVSASPAPRRPEPIAPTPKIVDAVRQAMNEVTPTFFVMPVEQRSWAILLGLCQAQIDFLVAQQTDGAAPAQRPSAPAVAVGLTGMSG